MPGSTDTQLSHGRAVPGRTPYRQGLIMLSRGFAGASAMCALVLLTAAPAVARTATVYSGYSDSVGRFTTGGSTATVYEGYSDMVGRVKRSGTTFTVYQGYSETAGRVKCSGSTCTVYEGYSNQVGRVKRRGATWYVYEGYSHQIGRVTGAGVSDGGFVGGAALLLLL